MSIPSPLRYAVLGTGGVANWHYNEITKRPGVVPVGLQDASADALKRFSADRPGVPTFTDPERLFTEAKPDLVSVCTPNKFHCELTLLALRHGAHVVCEKPMAMTTEEAERMEAARVAAGRLGGINFSYRNNAAFRFAKELLAAGELGRILRVNSVYLQSHFAAPGSTWAWRNDRTLAGFGALGDLGIHMIDGVRFVTGLGYRRTVGLAQVLVPEMAEAGTGVMKAVTTDTNASFLAEMDGGVVATFETSQCSPAYGNYFRIEVSGERGTLAVCSEEGDALWLFAGATLTRYSTWKSDLPKVVLPTNFKAKQPAVTPSGILGAIRGEGSEYPTFADGVAAQRVLDAIVRSMETRAWEAC